MTLMIPAAPTVLRSELVAAFVAVYAALEARAAHYSSQNSSAGIAHIAQLSYRLQRWIDSWWNDHLFQIAMRFDMSKPPFAAKPALKYNFCTWWLLSGHEQKAVKRYLVKLAEQIQEGAFDAKPELVRLTVPASRTVKLLADTLFASANL